MIALCNMMRKACGLVLMSLLLPSQASASAIGTRQQELGAPAGATGRERISINEGWRFMRTTSRTDKLVYDLTRRDIPAGEAAFLSELKPWILPSANDFIADRSKHSKRPDSNIGASVSFVQKAFDDSAWEIVDLPHDWAIKGPFYEGENVPVGGGMGRLPIQGIGWYRRQLSLSPADAGKSIYLDIDGAMSYSAVWVNGQIVGGWPYGYNSFRLDLTPYLQSGHDNLVAIRLDNPINSSRWYPGGGIYRNVWITKVETVHVSQWGTFITTRDVSAESATVDLAVQLENRGKKSRHIEVTTDVYTFDPATGRAGEKVAEFPLAKVEVPAGGEKKATKGSVTVKDPRLWGPPPTQRPNLYVAVTRLRDGGKTLDTYETTFGIRSLSFNPDKGLFVNGERIRIQGVNQHHDLGALGAAFNTRAAERQLEILRDLGCNAVRTAHNPPAPELLDLTDRMGFIVMDEVFDAWERRKTDNDFQLIFTNWHEADIRSFMRRDRNHASVVMWSYGNEVGEQTTSEAGAALSRRLRDIVHNEDATRPATASVNAARYADLFPGTLDVISLNYQGEGIRDTPAYANLTGSVVPPAYPLFHQAHQDKMLLSSETAAALSTRGTYLFPVTGEWSAPVRDGVPSGGGDPQAGFVSSYELHSANFGASADKVFATQDRHPYVAGEFVWSGWDYLGEPTPYYSARSSYFGIVDLAGFKKDRYHLYQARWRPDLRTAHILPHWNWPDRVGQVTPVHVFSAADEAELFLDGRSLGRRGKAESGNGTSYRFRWDDVVYRPGELRVETWKGGERWANGTVRTTGPAAGLRLKADRDVIRGDGLDLSFVTAEVVDSQGQFVAQATDALTFEVVSGPGEIVATDNGDPGDLVAFPSKARKAFGGLALAIVRARKGEKGAVVLAVTGKELVSARVALRVA